MRGEEGTSYGVKAEGFTYQVIIIQMKMAKIWVS